MSICQICVIEYTMLITITFCESPEVRLPHRWSNQIGTTSVTQSLSRSQPKGISRPHLQAERGRLPHAVFSFEGSP